ncbi:MAG: DegT/DnrJ/EryC1/StrS family aminotransferase [Proteobacteria bacterium]|nr:DegT/DnrJ/EryC1/StrS family aminotransferase [Pseudomonadota bacterium]
MLRSDYLTQGAAVPAFEKAMGRRLGAAHAIAVKSATSAPLALLADGERIGAQRVLHPALGILNPALDLRA